MLRVAGQALVAFLNVSFLPPMTQWYSGLIPYPILLPVQIIMIVVMIKIVTDFTRGRGYFVIPRPRIGFLMKWISYLYFSSMIIRYLLTMTWHPER